MQTNFGPLRLSETPQIDFNRWINVEANYNKARNICKGSLRRMGIKYRIDEEELMGMVCLYAVSRRSLRVHLDSNGEVASGKMLGFFTAASRSLLSNWVRDNTTASRTAPTPVVRINGGSGSNGNGGHNDNSIDIDVSRCDTSYRVVETTDIINTIAPSGVSRRILNALLENDGNCAATARDVDMDTRTVESFRKNFAKRYHEYQRESI